VRLLLVAAGVAGLAAARDPLPQAKQIEDQTLQQLLTIRRVYVDRLSGGETAVQIRDMIIASLQATKLFVITENQEKADVILKGSAEDLVFTDVFTTSDGIDARASLSLGSTNTKSTTQRRGTAATMGIGDRESTRIQERKHEAVASVRLINKDGDVIWSTTQESLGAKFRGAGSDVADKVTRQLVDDFERARGAHQASK
jgi:hypothetical protein